MIPRLDMRFPIRRQLSYWFGKEYKPQKGEYLLNHARSGIVLALRAALPHGGRVGVVTYNCHTVANAVVSTGCQCVFLDVTDDLKIDLCNLVSDTFLHKNGVLDAIIVTNLFGIRNDIQAIRKACPNAFIIVDNAHGYGLPAEGDCTVYSINQGKYPALGEGGILLVRNEEIGLRIEEMYRDLPGYSVFQFWKLFAVMKAKSFLYQPWLYGWFTMRLKAGRTNSADHTSVVARKMCKGVSRMYNAWLKDGGMRTKEEGGDQLFMDIVRTDNPAEVIAEYRANGIEADTHFKICIRWATEFGYVPGSCPNAERLVNHLVMVPNYYKKD